MNDKNEQEKLALKKLQNVNTKLLTELHKICEKYDIHYYLAYGGLLGAVRHKNYIPWDDDVDIIMYPEEYQKLKNVSSKLSPDFELIEPDNYNELFFDMVPRLQYKKSKIFPANNEFVKFYGEKRNRVALDIFLLAPLPGGIMQKVHILYIAILNGLAIAQRPFDMSNSNYGLALNIGKKILHSIGKHIPAQKMRNVCDKASRHYETNASISYVHVYNSDLYDLKTIFKKEWFGTGTLISLGEQKFRAPINYSKVLETCYGDYMKLPAEEERHPHFIDASALEIWD